MRFDFHIHMNHNEADAGRLTLIEQLLRILTGKVDAMAKTLDDVLAVVTAESTKIDSLIALVNGLKQQVADALSGATLPPSVQAKVDAVFDAATADAAKIDGALAANTGG